MNKVIVIVGPTGVGKTKLSIELATLLNGEIINADSTQIYKDLDIATAKATQNEMNNIPHHLMDIRDIEEDYSVFDYQKDARLCIEDILKRQKTPILVGGTGLYIKATLYDYKFNNSGVKNDYLNSTNEVLYCELLKIDSKTTIHPNNRKRIISALNYYEETKTPFSSKEKTDRLLFDAVFIGLTTTRDKLYSRINNRVDIMVNNGLVEEAKKIYETAIRTKAVLTPIGYKELFEYFDNKKSLVESIDLIRQRSRKYAKRQYTWFNNQMDIKWFNVDFEHFDITVSSVIDYIKEN